MKNKKIFNLGLYAEGIKQLKLIGIFSLIIMMLEAVLIPVGRIISIASNENGFKIDNAVASSVSGFEAHPILIFVFIIIAPLMALSLFSFLNKRNASDFYHSLPHTRLCIYLSYTASIATWLIMLIVSTSAVSIILHLIFDKFFTLIIASFIKLMIGCFAASLLVSASVIAAMTITGTMFTNIIISGLIIFLPRFVVMIITNAVTGQLPIVADESLFVLLSDNINIVTSFMFNIFIGRVDPLPPVLSAPSQIYTFVIAVLYLVLAAVLFCKRKSESAERSAPNRLIQAVYRITITMVFCSFVCYVIFSNFKDETQNIFAYVVLYIAAAAVYIAYELITTKRWKCVVRSLPGLAVVALLNIALFGAMYGIYKTNLNFIPSSNEIKSISVMNTNNNSYYYYGLYDILQLKNEEIEITDKEVIKIVADSLKDCTDKIENSSKNDYYFYYQNYNQYTFKINLEDKSKCRTVFVPAEKTQKIAKALKANEKYKENWTTLPAPVKNTITFSQDEISPEYGQDIIDVMSAEIKNVDFEKWFIYCASPDSYTSVAQVSYSTVYNGKSYNISVPLFPDLFPETCNKYFEYVYESSKENLPYIKDFFDTYNSDLKDSFHATVYSYNEDLEKHETYILNCDYKQLQEFLDYIYDKPASCGESFIALYVYDSSYNRRCIYAAFDDDIIKNMPGCFEKVDYDAMNNTYID